jgi:transcriptional regulator with XRE-family HTH domain
VKQNPKKLFGDAVKRKRLELGLTQERLAEAAELHWTYIGGIERGERNVSLLNIVKLAHALNVSPATLLRDIE